MWRRTKVRRFAFGSVPRVAALFCINVILH
jgi:hypothetical protein